MTPWKFTDASRRVVARIHDDGGLESCVSTREDVVAWVQEGNTILEPDPVVPSAEEIQEEAAVQYQPLRAVAAMSQAEIDAHIDSTFSTLNAAQRQALRVLARAVAVLLRRAFDGRL